MGNDDDDDSHKRSGFKECVGGHVVLMEPVVDLPKVS